ncbi:MAG TPA: hypothetical protein VEI03_01795, partial [Stellaceae bacterium]|nr:hypothetical protein [Stellaceae bacterium]
MGTILLDARMLRAAWQGKFYCSKASLPAAGAGRNGPLKSPVFARRWPLPTGGDPGAAIAWRTLLGHPQAAGFSPWDCRCRSVERASFRP